MIWFACKQCGKHHSRAEPLAGTLVFCECGQGNRVPWSSTAEAAEPEEALPAPPLPQRSGDKRRPNPDYCFNHEETPKEATCDACRCSFCSACAIALQGQTLCGPCKNFRLVGLSRPPRLSPLAIVAFVLGLVTIVVSLILTLAAGIASEMSDAGILVTIFCCLVAVVLSGGESVIGLLALRQIDRQPALGGMALAMTGATAGLTGLVWAFAVAFLSIARQLQG